MRLGNLINKGIKKEIALLSLVITLSVILYKLFNFHYAFNRDTWYYSFAHYRILQEQIRNGVLPLWNNYSALGSALIFKESLDLLSSPALFFLSVKDYLAIAGLVYFSLSIYFMYKYLASEGIKKAIALCAGIIWTTNGYFLWYLHELVIQSVCLYIPLTLLLVKRLASRQNVYRNWIFFIIVNAFQLTYSRWDLYEYSLWIIFLYIIFVIRINAQPGKNSITAKIKLSLLVLSGVCCAFLLAAPFTIPYLKTIFGSQRPGDFKYPVDYLNIRMLIQHLFPNTGIYDSRSYISLFVFPFALLALFRRGRIKVFSLALIVLYLSLAFKIKGFKLYEIIRLLPLHKGNINIIRTNVLFYFGITVLFACGLNDFITNHKKKYKTIITFFIPVMLVIAFLYFFFGLFYMYYSKYGFLNWLNYLSIGFFLIPLGLFVYNKQIKFFLIPKNTLFTIYIAIYTLVFSFLFNSRDINDSYNLREFERRVENELSYKFIPELKRLLNAPGSLPYRAADDNFHQNFLPMQLVETNSFYTPFTSKELCDIGMKVLGTNVCYPTMPNFLHGCSSVNIFYSLGSIKYFVFRKADFDSCNSTPKILVPAYSDEKFLVAENKRAFERIRFLDTYLVIKDKNEALDFLKKGGFEWFEKNFIVNINPVISKSAHGSRDISYRLITNKPSHLRIETDSNEEAMMIISNAYNKYWKINTDGKKNTLYLVNGFFQGVKVLPGRHIYDLYYFPDTLSIGIILSSITILLLVMLKRIHWEKF